jgi:FtsH-binding integral membrane protein
MKDNAIARGRNTIIAIACAYLLMETSLLLTRAWLGLPFPPGNILRYVVTPVLIFLMYKGSEWARFILVLRAVVSTIVGVYILYLVLSRTPDLLLLGFALAAIVLYGPVTAVLMFSKDVSQFIASQGARGKGYDQSAQ